MKLRKLSGIAALIAGLGIVYVSSPTVKVQVDKIIESGNNAIAELLHSNEPKDDTFSANLEKIVISHGELDELNSIKLDISGAGEEKNPEEFLERVVFLDRFRDKESSEGKTWSKQRIGVGFLITSRYALISMHNRGDAEKNLKTMAFNEGVFYNGQIIATSRKYDLALFRLAAGIKKVAPVQMAHERTMQRGETVYLPTKINTSGVSYRYGAKETPITVTNPEEEKLVRKGKSLGKIYYIDRSYLGEFYRYALKSTIPLQAYMSGSPVVNSKAQLVGLAIRMGDSSGSGTISVLPSEIFNFIKKYTEEAERHYTEKTGKNKVK